jgi:pimeloyl-ACP methyl ester carboxylesterase
MTARPSIAYLADGTRLAFRVTGQSTGDAPILLNRPLGGSMALWGEFAGRLSTQFQVIEFDPRGVGASSDLPLFHSTRAMARDAVALLDVLEVPRAYFFGLSLGGMVASWAAIDARERVARLVLASTLPKATAISHRIRSHVGPLLRALLTPGAGAEVKLVDEILSSQFRREHPTRVASIEQAVRRTPTKRRNLVRLALAAALHDADRALDGNSSRTLLLVGELDPIAGRVSQEELLEDLPRAILEVVPHAGHDLSLEAPLSLADSVVRFLRS